MFSSPWSREGTLLVSQGGRCPKAPLGAEGSAQNSAGDVLAVCAPGTSSLTSSSLCFTKHHKRQISSLISAYLWLPLKPHQAMLVVCTTRTGESIT